MTAWRHGLGLLWLSTVTAGAVVDGGAELWRRDGNTTAAPVVASISQYFEGNDGTWSSFQIQVGQKPQSIRVFPSTQATTTWVVEAEGCLSDAPSNCPDSRGGLFNPNNSLTWVANSIYNLGLEEDLGFGDVNGDFGFDTVALGLPGSGGPSVDHSIVAGIADTHLTWLGALGLNPMPTNFSTFNNPQPSFLSLLRTKNLIPSLTWAYTAGAVYRFDKVFGSLVLGGYDASKFTPTDLTFPFYQDIERNLLVGVQKITTDISSGSLVSDTFYALIDSTIPYLWLPEDVCDAFEKAFGLTYNSTAELYLVNDTLHSTLTSKNPNVTFTIGPDTTGGGTVDIAFPYAAFDLNITYPYVDGNKRYFPLKRASNSSQYTLGRTFLQEAYLIADFERSNFSVHPVKWDQNSQSSIVAIRSINDTSSSNSTNGSNPSGSTTSKSKSAPVGAIAGGVVGGILVIAILVLFWWLYRTKRLVFALKKKKSLELEGSGPLNAQDIPLVQPYKKDGPEGELDSGQIHELHTQHKFGLLEADSEVKLPNEMEAEVPRPIYEMEGSVMHPADVKIPSQPPTPGQIDAVWRQGTPGTDTMSTVASPLQSNEPWRGRQPLNGTASPPDSRAVSPPTRTISPPTRTISPPTRTISPPTRTISPPTQMPTPPIPFGPLARTTTDMSIPSIVLTEGSPDGTQVDMRTESSGTCIPFDRPEEQRDRSASRTRRLL